MAAAYAGYSRPLSWLDWSAASPAEVQSRITSTLSPGPRPAEFSRSASVPVTPPRDFLGLYVDRGPEILPLSPTLASAA